MNKSETINNIVSSAIREINLRGIDGAKISAIAEDAGVTKQLVYHYFKNKDELYQAVLDYVAMGAKLTKDTEIYDKLSPIEAIDHIIDNIRSGFSNNPSYSMFAIDQILHRNGHISKNNSYIMSMRQFIENVFSSIIKSGIDSGEFRDDLNYSYTFWMIFNTVSSGFLNNAMQFSISNIDMNNPDDARLWHKAARNFIMNAISK